MSKEKVLVYKSDGTKQCEKAAGISLAVMAKELEGIEIFSQENKYDGQMHITLCGSPTGKVNVFEIRRSDLEKAMALGFLEMK